MSRASPRHKQVIRAHGFLVFKCILYLNTPSFPVFHKTLELSHPLDYLSQFYTSTFAQTPVTQGGQLAQPFLRSRTAKVCSAAQLSWVHPPILWVSPTYTHQTMYNVVLTTFFTLQHSNTTPRGCRANMYICLNSEHAQSKFLIPICACLDFVKNDDYHHPSILRVDKGFWNPIL